MLGFSMLKNLRMMRRHHRHRRTILSPNYVKEPLLCVVL